MPELSAKLRGKKSYVFAELNAQRDALIKAGRPIIDFGMGDCTLGAPQKVIEALREAALDPARHHYSDYNGIPELRAEIVSWMEKRFGVTIDPDKEVTALIGSKEGIFRFPQAVLNDGDTALVPDPAYPPYASGVSAAGGAVFTMPLLEKNGFLPDLDAIPEDIKKKSRLIYVNYPNNPTSAVAPDEFYAKLYKEAGKYDWIIVSDLAYSELFEITPPRSMLEFDREKSRTIEFFSFSKSYNMTGWRLGFAVGNSEMIKGLLRIKTIQGSSPFEAVQIAGIAALRLDEDEMKSHRKFISDNRVWIKKIFDRCGLKYFDAHSSMYLWAKVPQGYDSAGWAKHLLLDMDILVTPGSSLGSYGEGYFRMTLTRGADDMSKLEKWLSKL